jgi:hypothetical protein
MDGIGLVAMRVKFLRLPLLILYSWLLILGIVLSGCQFPRIPSSESAETDIPISIDTSTPTTQTSPQDTPSELAPLLSMTPTLAATIPFTPTDTSIPTATSTVTVTPTISLTPTPTESLTPSATPQPAWTPLPLPCNMALFIEDVTAPDNSRFLPNYRFTKTWRIQNIGGCTWNSRYTLFLVDGDRMGSTRSAPVPGIVPPNARVDISISMVAPVDPDRYRGFWMMRDPQGEEFGFGIHDTGPILYRIYVDEPDPRFAYDLAHAVCRAEWRSNTGLLPCSGTPGSANGYVYYDTDPYLEHRREDEPTLVMSPRVANNGWISGTFPPYLVQAGDRFLAEIGCMAGASRCDVIFQLIYQIGVGQLQKIAEWREVHDGQATLIDMDLSHLAGNEIKLILRVDVNGSHEDDDVFWFLPHIRRNDP